MQVVSKSSSIFAYHLVCMINTRDHILITAFTLFVTKSYKAVTMNDLEKTSGLTKGAFYHYFKNKEEIYIEVVDKYFLANHMPKDQEIEEKGSLRDYLDLYMNHFISKANKLKEITNNETIDPSFVSLIMEAKENYPGFTEKLKETRNIVFNNWERIISRAKVNGEIISDIETDILAENFISISHSIFRYLLNCSSVEYALSMIKLQYNQMYRLVKK